MQASLDDQAQRRGGPVGKYSRAVLENNAIHALLAERLVDYDVLLMHGSALCMDGQAIVFNALGKHRNL